MHATHTRRPSGRPLLAAFCAAFALAPRAVPLFAEEPPVTTPVTSTAEAVEQADAPSPETATADLEVVFDSAAVDVRPQPKLSGPSAASLDLSRSVPFIGRRSNTRILSGYYIFAERNQANLNGVDPETELPLIQRIQLEETFSQNPDLTRRSNVVGLWASIPLREGSRRRASQESADFPNRTLVASIGTDPTRYRTSRKPPEVEVPGQGFFSRLRPHSGVLDRFKSEPQTTKPSPAAAPQVASPSSVEAAPKEATVPKPEAEKAQKGGAFHFIRRIWD